MNVEKLANLLTGVGLSLSNIGPVPLSDTGSTGVGEDGSTDVLESLNDTVSLDGSSDLLGSGGDGEERLGLESVREGLGGDGSRSGHVLVRRVGARSDQSDLELLGPSVGSNSLGELGDGGGEIGSVGSVDVRLELGEVLEGREKSEGRRPRSAQAQTRGSRRDEREEKETYDGDQLVVLSSLVGLEVGVELLGVGSDLGSLSSLKVSLHSRVEGEDGGGGSDLGSH